MLKRLEIQCVFKELVKDIVVKGQYYVGGLLFCRGGIHPFLGALRQPQEE